MKAVMPLYPAEGSTVASRMKTPASLALVIHSFWPFRIYSSPFSSALAWRAKASEPEPASLSA